VPANHHLSRVFSFWRAGGISSSNGRSSPCPVPISPDALAQLYARFLELKGSRRLPVEMTFEEYFSVWRSGRRGENFVGLDDGATRHGPSTDAQLITRPSTRLKGAIRTVVLLADFPDRPHHPDHGTGYYEAMLFSEGSFPTGSMRDYYRAVSGFDAASGIDVQGEVHGWFRLPQPLSFYADGNSGMGENFPTMPRAWRGMRCWPPWRRGSNSRHSTSSTNGW
jgi:immune inhibitor A